MWTIEECLRCQRDEDHGWRDCKHQWNETHIVTNGQTILSCLWELASMQQAYQFVRFRLRNTRSNATILSDIVEISPEKSYFL